MSHFEITLHGNCKTTYSCLIMSIEEFQESYYLKFYRQKIQSFYHFTTELIDKKTDQVIDVHQQMKEESELDRTVFEADHYAKHPLNLEKFTSKIIRFQFDLYASTIPIDGFNPMDEVSYPDLSKFYVEKVME